MTELEQLINDIDSFEYDEDDFASSKSIKYAKKFIEIIKKLFDEGLDYPYPSVILDNEISLNWRKGNVMLTVSFSKNGEITYAYILPKTSGYGHSPDNLSGNGRLCFSEKDIKASPFYRILTETYYFKAE